MADKLVEYHRRRHFDKTPEPPGETARRPRRGSGGSTSPRALAFVIQEHDATRLHYDFRLELDGALKSWAIPKGPSLDPSVKRLAVHVEDHPLDYGSFEGEIPAGHYGAGAVIVWDRGTWTPDGSARQARRDYDAGKLKFQLHGEKLTGAWMLVKSHMTGSRGKEQWLLIKERDAAAQPESAFDVTARLSGSVLTGKPLALKRRNGAASGSSATTKLDQAAAGGMPGKAAAGSRTKAAPPSEQGSSTVADVARLPGAVEGSMPDALRPQLATLVDAPPGGGRWSYRDEIRRLPRARANYRAKAPGWRRQRPCSGPAMATIWSERFGPQIKAFEALGLDSAWLDGEAVVLDENGVPSFQALQNAFETGQVESIIIYLFDVAYLHGHDLRQVPLGERRAVLRNLLRDVEPAVLRFSDRFLPFPPEDLLASACGMSLEGIIGKAVDSLYHEGRGQSWVKLKCRRRQEFVIGGYTDPSGSRAEFGALLLGVFDAAGKFHYAGRVGSGFTQASLRAVKQQLVSHQSSRTPFADVPRERGTAKTHWVKPVLVAECNFAEWSREGIVRQASFVAMRDDKPARQITREAAVLAAVVDTSAEEGQVKTMKGAGTRTEKTKKTKKTTRAAKTASARKTPPGSTVQKTPTASTTSKTSRTSKTSKTSKTTPAANLTQATKSTRSRSAEGDEKLVLGGVAITHAGRLVDPASGARKGELARYYAAVAQHMLPHLRGRPVSLVRAPQSIDGELFFQKHSAKLQIAGVTQYPDLDPGHPALMSLDTAEALCSAAQMNTVEFHTWNALADVLEKPDRMVFDLDPGEGVGWPRMLEAAQLTRGFLGELGLESFCKTSGGKGLHVVVPVTRHAGWDQLRDFSAAVAAHIAGALPKLFSAKMGPRNRVGKIFIDYLRNNRGASTVAAFSARARPGLGVSVPVSWDELPDLRAGDQWNIRNVHQRLASQRTDPWAAYASIRQRATTAMRKRLGK